MVHFPDRLHHGAPAEGVVAARAVGGLGAGELEERQSQRPPQFPLQLAPQQGKLVGAAGLLVDGTHLETDEMAPDLGCFLAAQQGTHPRRSGGGSRVEGHRSALLEEGDLAELGLESLHVSRLGVPARDGDPEPRLLAVRRRLPGSRGGRGAPQLDDDHRSESGGEGAADPHGQLVEPGAVPAVRRARQVDRGAGSESLRSRIGPVGRSPVDDQVGKLAVDVDPPPTGEGAAHPPAVGDALTDRLDEPRRDLAISPLASGAHGVSSSSRRPGTVAASASRSAWSAPSSTTPDHSSMKTFLNSIARAQPESGNV